MKINTGSYYKLRCGAVVRAIDRNHFHVIAIDKVNKKHEKLISDLKSLSKSLCLINGKGHAHGEQFDITRHLKAYEEE